MLEAVARAFEVDVATSKATCIDLLRANEFDVLVACERLSDGSGLELLSHVGQRWPRVIRILAIEPERRALLRGRLGPFKLFETLSYPIDEAKLEAALGRAAEQIAANEAAEARDAPPPTPAPVPAPAWPAQPIADAKPAQPATGARPYQAPPPGQRPSPVGVVPQETSRPTNAPPKDARSPAARTVDAAPPAGNPRNVSPPSDSRSAGGASFASKPKTDPGYPPLPSKGSKIVPLGSPASPDYKILPHTYKESMPGTLRAARDAPKKATLQEKAAALAADALSAVSKYIKPSEQSPPEHPPPKAPPPGKKR